MNIFFSPNKKRQKIEYVVAVIAFFGGIALIFVFGQKGQPFQIVLGVLAITLGITLIRIAWLRSYPIKDQVALALNSRAYLFLLLAMIIKNLFIKKSKQIHL
jgi:hypothetical protein